MATVFTSPVFVLCLELTKDEARMLKVLNVANEPALVQGNSRVNFNKRKRSI